MTNNQENDDPAKKELERLRQKKRKLQEDIKQAEAEERRLAIRDARSRVELAKVKLRYRNNLRKVEEYKAKDAAAKKRQNQGKT